MAILGGIILIFGVVDLVGSFAELDVWGEWIGVQLPDLLWTLSAYIEIALGGWLISMGSSGGDASEEDASS